MNSKRLSQEEFQAKRDEALSNEPIARNIPLSAIELTENSYDDRVAVIDGRKVAVDTQFFTDLSKVLHISGGMKKDLVGGKDSNKDGGKLFSKMVETMKIVRNSRDGGGTVTIIGSPKDGTITGLTDRGCSRIPNSDLFGLAENLIDRYPNLNPVDIDVSGGGMGVGITLLNDIYHPFKSIGGPDGGDETFKFGITLSNGNVTSLDDFAYRLVCENGMMRMARDNQFKLKEISSEGIRKMLETIQEMEKRSFMPMAFDRNMKIAGSTQASFREIENLYKKVVGNLAVEDEDMKKHYQAEIARNFFQGYVRTAAKLHTKEMLPSSLTEKQKSFIQSGQNMWDVINGITWLGSHDSGYQWKNQGFFRKLGGQLMYNEYDLANVGLLKL